MEKVYLQKIQQNGISFYSFIWNAVKLNRMRQMYKPNEVQDIQRPYIEAKVKEIAAYVAGKSTKVEHTYTGLIPNSPIVVFGDKIEIHSELVTEVYPDGRKESITKYFVNLPSTPEEAKDYEGQVKIIDGQHRIIAFDKAYIDESAKDADKYQMSFIAFKDIQDNVKKELFMVTNEKQDKVKTNLLIYIKKDLNLLPDEAEFTYEIIDFLNKESDSPLYNKIMFGAEKIKKGYQQTQVSKIFEKYGANEFYHKNLEGVKNDKSKFETIIINYLKAWQEATGIKYSSTSSETFIKISGFRYVMRMFNDICNDLMTNGEKMTKDNFLKTINLFPAALSLENVKCLFGDDKNVMTEDIKQRSYSFRSEGATTALAKSDVYKVLNYKKSIDHERGYEFI